MKLNIIGRGKGWENAPLDELSWGITLTNLNRRVDLVIDMNVYEDGRWGEAERQGAIKSRSLAASEGIPYIDLNSYPLEEIVNYFKADYFSSTVDYALALAIYRGFTTIELYGVNMGFGSEYKYQKPSAEFWIGQAMGRGIDVKIHGDLTSLLKTVGCKIYGYDIPQRFY